MALLRKRTLVFPRGGRLKISGAGGVLLQARGAYVPQAPSNRKSNMVDYFVFCYNNFGSSDIFQPFILNVFQRFICSRVFRKHRLT